jgi:hypothetical protein
MWYAATERKSVSSFHWSTTLIVRDLHAAVTELRRQNATFISVEQEDVTPLGESGAKGVLIRDPDGHALLLRSE